MFNSSCKETGVRFLPFFSFFLFSIASFAVQSDINTLEKSPIQTRIEYEEKVENSPFAIIPHKPTYLLPFTYNHNIKNYNIYENEDAPQQLELQFQISFKMPLLLDVADYDVSVYFAYSQMSLWQAYNSDESSPFRETNYEPELFAQWDGDIKLGNGWKFKAATFGFTHQSNGRSEPLSRSWNRLESRLVVEHGNLILAINPWLRFEESESEDNNADLLDYYGHGKLVMAYKLNEHSFSLISRNNIESRFKKGSVEGSWSFPIHNRVKGYIKVFSGYGNSLIEYNQYTSTVGIGVSMIDWL